MDPKANIKEQIEIARAIIRADDDGAPASDPCALRVDEADVVRLAELVIALHEWRQGGGFDPYARNAGR